MKVEKQRIDQLLFARGLFPSREAARRAIMAGLVSRPNGERIDKAGTMVKSTDEFLVQQTDHNYVSRGGLKLEGAISAFDFDLSGKVVIDVGASTGGFTDCSLQHGAAHVYAVDVGYGQLAWKLRNDPRVSVMERVNFRNVEKEQFNPLPEVAVMDVSFISTKLLLPKLQEVLASPKHIVSLIKPQFEAGRENVGKGGIVRDPEVHLQVICDLVTFIEGLGMQCNGLHYSPISGGDGNIEYLAWWTPRLTPSTSAPDWTEVAKEVVRTAWYELNHVQIDVLR